MKKNQNEVLQKNQVARAEITGMTAEGNGVCRIDGMAVFVPNTAVGDEIDCRIVKVLKSYAFGKTERLIVSSPARTEPDCAAFPQCGGCVFRHMNYAEELRLKASFAAESFRRLGKLEVEWEAPEASPQLEGYRNKAQYPVAEHDGKAVCGFYARNSHRVVPHKTCRLQPEIFEQIAARVVDFTNENKIRAYNEETGMGVLRHIYLRRGAHSGAVMLLLVCAVPEEKFLRFAQQIGGEFPEIQSVLMNMNPARTNVILGKRTVVLAGKPVIRDKMCGLETELAPEAFYQVNTAAAERLYGIAAEYAQLTGAETLLDLYCGAGLIGLSMEKKAKRVLGVEIVPQAVENAKENAVRNGISNAEFFCGDAGEVARVLSERGERPDVIVADPARKGCDAKTLAAMVSMAPERIVMISCNHATAARDCAYLCENGYRIERARAVDLFPRTGHIECVVLMSRVKE